MKDYSSQLQLALSAAVAGGNILREHSGDRLAQNEKESRRDVVTAIDLYTQQEIVRCIKAKDNAPIIAEESSVEEKKDITKGSCWIIDPIDGTVNYINNIPLSAVSIAYMDEGKPVVGVIYNPTLNELYYGAEGIGVYKNNVKIKIRGGSPEELLYAMSFSGKSYHSAMRQNEYDLFQDINDTTRGCLRTGSAALNLAYLASGRFGGCTGRDTKAWDIMAGILLARLAGARIEYTVTNAEKFLINYIAGTPEAFELLSKKVSEHFK